MGMENFVYSKIFIPLSMMASSFTGEKEGRKEGEKKKE